MTKHNLLIKSLLFCFSVATILGCSSTPKTLSDAESFRYGNEVGDERDVEISYKNRVRSSVINTSMQHYYVYGNGDPTTHQGLNPHVGWDVAVVGSMPFNSTFGNVFAASWLMEGLSAQRVYYNESVAAFYHGSVAFYVPIKKGEYKDRVEAIEKSFDKYRDLYFSAVGEVGFTTCSMPNDDGDYTPAMRYVEYFKGVFREWGYGCSGLNRLHVTVAGSTSPTYDAEVFILLYNQSSEVRWKKDSYKTLYYNIKELAASVDGVAMYNEPMSRFYHMYKADAEVRYQKPSLDKFASN